MSDERPDLGTRSPEGIGKFKVPSECRDSASRADPSRHDSTRANHGFHRHFRDIPAKVASRLVFEDREIQVRIPLESHFLNDSAGAIEVFRCARDGLADPPCNPIRKKTQVFLPSYRPFGK
jgi:hypothetical protein